jgi:hypothetical protein
MPGGRNMKATTVRFGADLWRLLEREADCAGVSISQFIREAALTRASAAAAVRGEDPVLLLGGLRSQRDDADDPVPADQEQHRKRPRGRAREEAAEQRAGAVALAAQSEQAVRHAQSLAARSEETIRKVSARRARPQQRS